MSREKGKTPSAETIISKESEIQTGFSETVIEKRLVGRHIRMMGSETAAQGSLNKIESAEVGPTHARRYTLSPRGLPGSAKLGLRIGPIPQRLRGPAHRKGCTARYHRALLVFPRRRWMKKGDYRPYRVR